MEKGTQLFAYYTRQDFFVDYEEISRPREVKERRFEESLYRGFLSDKAGALLELGLSGSCPPLSPSLWFLRLLAQAFVAGAAQKPGETPPLTEETLSKLRRLVPPARGSEYLDEQWIRRWWGLLGEACEKRLRTYEGSAEKFFLDKNPAFHPAGRVCFHLAENPGDGVFPFALLATYSAGKEAKELPLKNALRQYRSDRRELSLLLSAVSRAAQKSGLISRFADSGEIFSPLGLTKEEAYTFLTEIPLYEECEIRCRVPDWWQKRSGVVGLTLHLGEKPSAELGLQTLLSLRPALTVDGGELSPEELRALAAEDEGLVFLKGKWVEISRERLEEALAAYERARRLGEEIPFYKAMRLQLGGEAAGEKQDCAVTVSNGQWLQSLLKKPVDLKMEPFAPPPGFRGQLRPYQLAGAGWMKRHVDAGFGVCLADDMGLGKTVQLLALLEDRRPRGDRTLLVAPASLLFNWEKELQSFAPSIAYEVIRDARQEPGAGLCLSSYGVCARSAALQSADWDMVVLDEAQRIKNPGAKQTKAVRGLKARNRVALTGTPIENGLMDLWSLFDFLNPGLLGNEREFTALMRRMEREGRGYERLRSLVGPFILRRMKADVLPELPEKLERDIYVEPGRKQRALYLKVTGELREAIENGAGGIARKGLVLSTIMKLKQICNHPDQYLGFGEYSPGQSGKFLALQNICETVYERRERMLVFTQFRELCGPLEAFLEGIFGRKGLVLHGGVPAGRRGKLVERFNGEEYVPFMVLSLKAGGLGLNLTAASHVVHFDRWWNPAAEDQATDRAYRMGQRQDVLVHRLICAGTLEERIEALLRRKQKLFGDVILPAGEGWVTELNNDQLMELIRLGVE